MQGFPIQLAKVQPPPLRAATLHRERLFKWLDEHVERRLLLLTAEAGFGKTTLLADWVRRAPVRVAWYRVEDDDANWASFLRYMVASGREIDPEFGQLTTVLLDELAAGANNRDVVRATFFRELEELVANRRIVFVLDDTHLLRKIRDVVTLLSDLINKGPQGITWILSARRRTGVSIGKLRAVGEMHELRRDDLKFQVDECTELFATTFERPMTTDLVHTVIRRTEGWVASLQLVNTATRDRTDAERRSFIRSLSGARGEVYDYLAEEVVGDLEPNLQDVLMRASIMRVVTVSNVELVTGLPTVDAAAALEEVVPLGLLDPVGADEPDAYRCHPLVREFLEARLRQECGDDYVTDLHRRLAVAHEGIDWRTAAHHYEAISATDDLQRVLIESAPTIMARGEFDIAKRHAEQLSGRASPMIRIFTSRVLLDEGHLGAALADAEGALDGSAEGDPLRALALANYVTINLVAGDVSEALRANEVLLRSDAPPRLLEIAVANRFLINASRGGAIDDYLRHLMAMEHGHRESGSTHYLGVTLLNIGVVARLRAQPALALSKSAEAIDLLRAGPRRAEANAARMTHAWALAHLGDWVAAKQELQSAIAESEGLARNEALVESAETWIRYGDLAGASRIVEMALADVRQSRLSVMHLPLVEAELRIRQGRLSAAEEILGLPWNPEACVSVDYPTFRSFAEALLAFRMRTSDADEIVEKALAEVIARRADLYVRPLTLISAALGDPTAIDGRVSSVAAVDRAALSVVAEVVCSILPFVGDELLRTIRDEAVARPERWQDALRALLREAGDANLHAADLLELVGGREDVVLLRRIARSKVAKRTHRRLGTELARRTAPKLFVEDLGRIRLQIGDTELTDVDPRRKVLELVCFLITRPKLSATRDEVLDAVWPDTDPLSALNSLNQTLYFLRRVLEPNYSEELSPAYIHHDSDILWLDPALVSSRSLECASLLRRLERSWTRADLQALSLAYSGQFALDFSYEEWANSFRGRLHAGYLQAMEFAIKGELEAGRAPEAITIARRVLEIDPGADQIERLLLRAYFDSSAHAAVREQYQHYAARIRDEIGVEPPTLTAMIRNGFEPQVDT